MTAWTTPRTWQVNETATAALLNTHLRDNELHLYEKLQQLSFDFPFVSDYRYLSGSATVGTANNCHYNRVLGTGTITKVRVFVTVANGNIGVAVYDNTGADVSAAPNSRIATSGSVACPAAGAADVSIGATVTIGVLEHWFALSASGITATFGHAGAVVSDWKNGWIAAQTTAHPPPSPAAPTATAAVCFHMAGVP